ncbi:hypothetical protein JG687_00005578 [Phytophthora cactorum]|uniref:Uncharacterized protein n=1 Tax=Phytophthora cactorum TaxID=29920 RepID=A0A8T1UQ80_9STRA|nr:hypothetical protein JG687_00005578 [Phytophthora cactorum]
MLTTEMEPGTLYISNSEHIVSSSMVVFRRLAETKLKSFQFQIMTIEAPRTKDETDTSHRRVQRTLGQFSDPDASATTRTFSKGNKGIHDLHPRTKHAAEKIAAVGNVGRKEEKAYYTGGIDYLRDEHRKVFGTLTKEKKIANSQDFGSQSSSMFSQEVSPFSSPASTEWDTNTNYYWAPLSV